MIRFNSSRVMGTPSYYVQMLMPRNIGTQVVKVTQENPYKARKQKQLTPKESRVGFATWGTQASFTLPTPLPTTSKTDFISGKWQLNAQEGTVSQTGDRQQCVAVVDAPVGDHYTIKCRARKDGGEEGFIVVFNYVDPQHYCWVNFGGWGNTQHAIEQVGGTGKIQTAMKPGMVETGRWYDVTLTVAGDSVKAWLDDDLVFDEVLKQNTSLGVFSCATIDESTGELIVKVVNSQEEGTTAKLNLQNFDVKSAKLIQLRANDGEDENSLTNPTNISPTYHELSPEGHTVEVELPAFSLNIIRIKQ